MLNYELFFNIHLRQAKRNGLLIILQKVLIQNLFILYYCKMKGIINLFFIIILYKGKWIILYCLYYILHTLDLKRIV